jgi:hypothetical protein
MLLNQEKPSVVNLFQPNKLINTECLCLRLFMRKFLDYLASERDILVALNDFRVACGILEWNKLTGKGTKYKVLRAGSRLLKVLPRS